MKPSKKQEKTHVQLLRNGLVQKAIIFKKTYYYANLSLALITKLGSDHSIHETSSW